MFYDSAKVFVKAGHGGNGMVAYRREKYVPAGGPSGGDGGKGGSVIFIADSNVHTLLDFHHKVHIKASHGEDGKAKNMHGANAEDLLIKVPVGTIVKKEDGTLVGDLIANHQRLVVAKGGKGGKGNARFKSSINRAPDVADKGEPGEEGWLYLELKLLADVGLVGFPNVGKSSIISVVSAAKPKIADYHFTTIDPNLGVVRVGDEESFVLVDIPGLVEGAADGVGLGHRFLRHVERTRLMLHVLDISGSEGRNPLEDYVKIRHEMEEYNPKLASKPQIMVANKMDLPGASENLQRLKEMFVEDGYDAVIVGQDEPLPEYEEKQVVEIYPVCAATNTGLRELMLRTWTVLNELPIEEAEDKDTDESDAIKITRFEEDTEPDLYIKRDDSAAFIVCGKEVEKQINRTNFSNEAAVNRLLKILRSMGVDKALRNAGAVTGDTVVVGIMEFEFYD